MSRLPVVRVQTRSKRLPGHRMEEKHIRALPRSRQYNQRRGFRLHLAADPDLYAVYFSDLVRNQTTLSAEDRGAAWHAFDLASERVNAGRVA